MDESIQSIMCFGVPGETARMILPIRKFEEGPSQLPPQFSFNSRHIQLSPSTELLCSCTEDKDLVLVDISSDRESRSTFLHGISSYQWREAGGEQQDQLAILTVTQDLVVYTLDLSALTFQVVSQWTARALLRLLGVEQMKEVRILDYWGDGLCLQMQQPRMIVRLELGSREIRVAGRLELPESAAILDLCHSSLMLAASAHSLCILLSLAHGSLLTTGIIEKMYTLCSKRLYALDTVPPAVYSIHQGGLLADWTVADSGAIEWAGLTPDFSKIIVYTSARTIHVLDSELSGPEDISAATSESFPSSPNVLNSVQLPPSLGDLVVRDCVLHGQVVYLTFSKDPSSTTLAVVSLVDPKVELERIEGSVLLLKALHDATVLLSPRQLSLHFHQDLTYVPQSRHGLYDHLPDEIARRISSWNDFSNRKTVLVHSLDQKDVDVPYMVLQSLVEEVRKSIALGPTKLQEQQDYLKEILAEVYYTFQQNISTPSQDYGLLLLDMLVALEESDTEGSAVGEFRQLLCLHAIQVRNLIRHDPAEDEEGEEPNSVFDQWDDYLLQEVVDSALISGEMLKLSQYLSTRKKLSGNEIHIICQKRSHAIIVDLIVNNHLSSARNFISQIGLSYKKVFLSLFKTSADAAVQANLYAEVKDILSSEQLLSIFNLRTLQTLYPCTAIEKALPFYTKANISTLLQSYQSDPKPPQWKIGDLGPTDFGTIVPGRYFFPIFDWCKDWTEATWERIFLEAYLTGAQKEFPKDCSPATCWLYLLHHCRGDLLRTWVGGDSQQPLCHLPLDMPDFSQGPPHLREELLNILASRFSHVYLQQKKSMLLSHTGKCGTYIVCSQIAAEPCRVIQNSDQESGRCSVTNVQLPRMLTKSDFFFLRLPYLHSIILGMCLPLQGKFCEDELENFPQLLQRLGRSQKLVLRPEECPGHQDYLRKEDFSHRLIHYCLKHSLITVLFFYLTESASPIPSCFNCSSPILHFIKVMKNTLLKKQLHSLKEAMSPLVEMPSSPGCSKQIPIPIEEDSIESQNRVDNLPSYPMSPEQSYTLSSASVEDFKAQSGPKSPTSPTRGSESCRCSGDYTEPQMSQNSNFSCSSIEESEDNSNTQGLLRVGGRLKYSYLNENQNFPLLQPKPPRQESLIKNLLTENADIPEAIDENQEDSSILETTFVIEDEESNKDIGTPKIEISEVSVIDKSEGKYSKEPVVSVEALDKKELCHDDPAHLNVVEADLNRPKEATSGIINISTEANESASKEKAVSVEIVDTSTKDYLQSSEKAKLSRWKPIDSLCLEDVKESEDDDENYSSSAYIEWPEILKKEVIRPEALEKAVNLEDFEKAAESRQLSKEHLEESTEQGSCIKAESKSWEDPIESGLAAAESDNPAVPERELANESENLIQDSPQSDTQRWKLIPLPFKQ
ncbi:hypothetical protein LAZ67_11000431 [Cordylochernes scorpioides]|uniref:Uncharacterized protein n=1 Tax=Cordylochernes scorpioides TaxID=51811 RepID=A0ABY6KYB2_9ARAC|nr:hypothetical protein LAZ67_11000431 [Cordylochernes scorpioides]